MAAMTMPTVDIRQRPAMLARTSSLVSFADSCANDVVSESVRPIVWPSRIPLTDRDSCTFVDMVASCRWRSPVIFLRSVPTRRLIHTNSGSSASDTMVRRQSSAVMATTVATTVVTFDTSEVAVEVTVDCMPPMSLAMRDCTSPVRVLVKNASDMRCRWS